MDELKKSLEGHRDDEAKGKTVSKEVEGVLAVHVKSVDVVEAVDDSLVELLLLKLEVCGVCKSFSLEKSTDNTRVICNKIKHFPVELPEKTGDCGNLLTIQLLAQSPLLPTSGSVLGTSQLHLHQLIQDTPLAGHCMLKDSSGEGFAKLSADFVFCYGSFGFGESYQLHHAVHKPVDYLHYSLFPRLQLPEHRTDSNGLVLTTQPTRNPSFIPFKNHASLCVQQASFHTEPTPTPHLLLQRMTRLHPLYGQYKTISDRRERIRFLEKLVRTKDSEAEAADVGVTARNPRFSITTH